MLPPPVNLPKACCVPETNAFRQFRWRIGRHMAFDIRRIDLGKLNSMTKYPSILTYHALGDKGVLQETVQIPFEGRIIGTEKVDYTNARLIFCPEHSDLVGNR